MDRGLSKAAMLASSIFVIVFTLAAVFVRTDGVLNRIYGLFMGIGSYLVYSWANPHDGWAFLLSVVANIVVYYLVLIATYKGMLLLGFWKKRAGGSS